MDITETLFKRFAAWQGQRKGRRAYNEHGIDLAELAPRLTIVARALCNAPIEVQAAVREGGWQGSVFHLPARADRYGSVELNFNYYLFRVFYLSKQRELGLNWNGSAGDLEGSRKAAADSAPQVLAALEREFVHFGALHERLREGLEDTTWLYGKWMVERGPFLDGARPAPDGVAPTATHAEITTEIASKPVEDVQSIAVDKEKQEEYMLTHNFEKIETAEEFDDIWRDFDGDDSLDDDLQALNELDLKHTVRVDDTVHSIYRAEMAGQLSVAECEALEEGGTYYSYPEWNVGKGAYLQDHCRVFPLLFRSRNKAYAASVVQREQRKIMALKKQMAAFQNAFSQVRRSERGNEFDLDQVTDMLTDIKARSTPRENVYISQRKRRKYLSLLFLIDLSLSGDAYVAGEKVIEIAKQAVIVLGEVFTEFEVEFQVDGFFSKTRNFCSYVTLKHFRDSWEHGKANLGQVRPQGFTRIGPAIRHAGALLQKRGSRRRWVVLLSDGKPNDFDRYEGDYGVQDIKHALHELRQQQVNSYAIAIEEQARHYLPRMFGVDHYCILADPKELVPAVMGLYTRLAGNV